jgi:hypothetical protein
LDTSATDKKYKYVIVDAQLIVKMRTVNPEILAKHNKTFQTKRAQYPIRDTAIRVENLPIGTKDYTSPPVVSGKIPNMVVVGLTKIVAASGNFNCDPWNFQNFGLKSISLVCESDPSRTRTYEVDFNGKMYLQGYQSIFKAMPRMYGGGNDISRDEYIKGNSLFLFDLQNSTPEFHVAETGQFRVKFG